jgi:dihydroorotate dehydrogenase
MDIYRNIRPVLFRLEPELAHRAALTSLDIAYRLGFRRVLEEKPTIVMGLRFPNPVGLAAGFDKNGGYIEPLSGLGFGFIEVGTITPQAQYGNPRPRLFRIPAAQALINRMGFNNEGVEAAIENISRSRCTSLIGISIGKNATTPISDASSDYLTCYRRVYKYASYVALNISSPGTRHLRRLQEPEYLSHLLRLLKLEQGRLAEEHARYVPLVVKLAPDFGSEALRQTCEMMLHHDVDGIIATNTTLSREGVQGLPQASEAGGLSGAPLRERALDMLMKINKYVEGRVPLIASGGIMDAADAQARIDAGASLVQVYTGLIYRGPGLVRDMVYSMRLNSARDGCRLTDTSADVTRSAASC